MPEVKRNMAANALRRGRFSAPHENYFVTVCLEPRLPILTSAIAQRILDEAHSMVTDATWNLRCMTVMPDHIHLLFTLGERLTLSQSIARLKARSRSSFDLKTADWQDNFYDHHFRADDSIEATIRYIFMNASHAGLVSSTDTWPYFHCCPEDWSWFEKLTDSGQPFPEWLL